MPAPTGLLPAERHCRIAECNPHRAFCTQMPFSACAPEWAPWQESSCPHPTRNEMKTNSLHRTLLASVIGTAFAFGFSAPSGARALDAVADQQAQGQDSDAREARRKARQEAREEAAQQREAA